MADYTSSKYNALMGLLGKGLSEGAQAGSAGFLQQMRGDQDLDRQTRMQAFEQPFKQGQLDVAKQQANTQEQYRQDQARHMAEQDKEAKLKLLLGVGGVGGDGKPLGAEAQKVSNLIDSARDALNKTETLSTQNPKTAAAHTFIQGLPFGGSINNSLASWLGGAYKNINDSKGITKEAMQNVDTGAAATGDQSATFKNWSGPGVMDILSGHAPDNSGAVRDKLNTMQQGYGRQGRTISPEMLKAAGMENDPIAKQALAQQDARQQAARQQALSRLAPEDQQLYQEIVSNPGHPNAAVARRDLERRYGRIF